MVLVHSKPALSQCLLFSAVVFIIFITLACLLSLAKYIFCKDRLVWFCLVMSIVSHT